MSYPSSDSQITYKDYESFTGFTLGKMLDEYKMFVVDLHNSQLNTIKTYLWLSVVIIGAICSALMTTDFHFETVTGGQAISISTLLLFLVLEDIRFRDETVAGRAWRRHSTDDRLIFRTA